MNDRKNGGGDRETYICAHRERVREKVGEIFREREGITERAKRRERKKVRERDRLREREIKLPLVLN